ncbi:uncharacterized protein LOC130914776 [Corythoichthys intestinalis]|uniref:uncharacterized protein LOC130914776 n=1 Tax=Corythoichthys intestinalis TaxID=161448 RepID=UPI0025A63B91|nr:uncharacterized protein LOC130914776 [Corythoichthys intestinalis]
MCLAPGLSVRVCLLLLQPQDTKFPHRHSKQSRRSICHSCQVCKMSTDRPKRNIIRKKYDISDGMPWCEERLVRKVLFLSLREFRDTHRATHGNLSTHGHKRKPASKTTLPPEPQKSSQKPQQQRVSHRLQNKQKKTHDLQNTQVKSKQNRDHSNKVQKRTSSQDVSSRKTKSIHTDQRTYTKPKGYREKTVPHTSLQQHAHKNSISTRSLRSYKMSNSSSVLTSKYTNTTKQTQISQHKHSVKNRRPPRNVQTLVKTHVPARNQRSSSPKGIRGSLVNGTIQCQSSLSGSSSWSWPLQTRPQRHHVNLLCDEDDPHSRRPRLQAQRKFAQSPPSSPGPPLMSSTQCRQGHSLAVITSLTRRRPKTEDFLSFLCLRGSAALPRNMAFLSGRENEPVANRHFNSCLSTWPKATIDRKNTVAQTVRPGFRSPNLGGSDSVEDSSICHLTAREQRRRERERKEEEGQRIKNECMETGRSEEVTKHHLRPRHFSMQLKRNKKVTRVSDQSTSFVRPVSSMKPKTGGGSQQSPRPSNTSKLRGHSQSQPEVKSNHLSQHSNHQLPHNQCLPVCKFYRNPKTLRGLQNSGKNPSRAPAQMPLTTNLATRQLKETAGVVRLSRRKRGLPPDANPTSLNHFSTDNPLKKCRTQQSNGDNRLDNNYGETEANCKEDVQVEHTVRKVRKTVDKEIKQDTRIGELKMIRDSFVAENLQNKVNIRSFGSAASITTLEVKHKSDLGPVSEVICRSMREKRLQKNLKIGSTQISKTIPRITVSRTVIRAAGHAAVPKARVNSVTSPYVHKNPPANNSAKHSPKGTKKGASKDIVTFISPASSCSNDDSKCAAVGPTKGWADDSTKDGSYSVTSKGSTKRLRQIKSTTSTVKTRSSPRILLKR